MAETTQQAPAAEPATPAPATAAPAPEAPKELEGIRILSSSSSLEKGEVISIRFPAEMIAPDQVGQPVAKGVYAISHADCFQAVWKSASRLDLEVVKGLPPLQTITVTIPTQTAANGQRVQGTEEKFPSSDIHNAEPIWDSVRYNLPGRPLYFKAWDEAYAEALAEAVPGMYFMYGTQRIPANVRPVTAAEASEAFNKEDINYGDAPDDAGAYSQMPPDQIIPGLWQVTAPYVTDRSKNLTLYVPKFDYCDINGCYVDKGIHSWSCPDPDLELTCSNQDIGAYKVFLQLGIPARTANAEELLRSLKWKVMEPAHSDQYIPMEWKDGALCATVRKRQVRMTLEPSPATRYNMADGQAVDGLEKLNLRIDTAGLELQLLCEDGGYEALSPDARTGDGKPLSDKVLLRPGAPYIYSDFMADALQSGGGMKIRCRYGCITNGQVKVWKIDSSGANAARLLGSYGKYYGENKMREEDGQAGKDGQQEAAADPLRPADPENQPTLPSDRLPGVTGQATYGLAGSRGEATIDLAKLFPGEPAKGFYFIEMCGTPLRYSKGGRPFINQGLLQVTNLGLVWKLGGDHVFAWAYQLDNAQPVAEGGLELLDKDGNLLATLPVANGIAQGSFPKGTEYLRLSAQDDALTVAARLESKYEYSDGDWETAALISEGIDPGKIPQAKIFLFSDRSLYRPGETAHIKGIVRTLTGNSLSVPDLERVTATYSEDGSETTLEAKVADDGSFTLDVPARNRGNMSINFALAYKGDSTYESPDYAMARAHGWDPSKRRNDLYHTSRLLKDSRSAFFSLPIQDFRRNEFEVKSALEADLDKREARVNAVAANFTTTPVAHGKVQWSLACSPANFYPKQWSEFRFGDHRENPWEYYYVYNYGFSASHYRPVRFSCSGKLDKQGRGEHTFALPELPAACRMKLAATVKVTNGNELSIYSVRKKEIDTSNAYAGIKALNCLPRANGKMPVEFIAVKPDGQAWDGEPLSAYITVTRRAFRPYRYGFRYRSSVRNDESEESVFTAPIELDGKPQQVNIPLQQSGRYDIVISGKDNEGHPFQSATRHYVWGDNISPWQYFGNNRVELVPDKPIYREGETARILVQTPVDAELLVTIERENVLRHYRRSVTVSEPVISIPIEAGDAPNVEVGVFLVQGANGRGQNGNPLMKIGSETLRIVPTGKTLGISLAATPQSQLPGETCTVSGVVTDAQGKPVPHASVTLYAEDEGTLQVMGYKLPDPLTFFHSDRPHAVITYSSLGRLLSERLNDRDFGNKGVFIGGGVGSGRYNEASEIDDKGIEYLRDNFAPCAVWLADVRTDAEGRFSATYANPDTLTRYRLMAVAANQDRFGSAQASYIVVKPVMLEPAAPLSATEGDTLNVPVTLSMLPAELGLAPDAAVRWRVSISGSNVSLPLPEQTVELKGSVPVTVMFPVHVGSTGEAKLQWRVQEETPTHDKARDAVQLSFETVHATPILREPVEVIMKSGQTGSLGQWLKNSYRKGGSVDLTFSTSPLAGLGYPIKYLFEYPYGCAEQLSSTLMPWLLKDELKTALGIDYPHECDTEKLVAETLGKLQKRRLGPGRYGYWDGDSEPSEYSPYVVLIKVLAKENGYKPKELDEDLEGLAETLRRELDEAERYGSVPGRKCFMSLYVLARTGKMKQEDRDRLLEVMREQSDRIASLDVQHRAMLALVARLTGLKEEDDSYDGRASSPGWDCHLPSLQVLHTLLAIEKDANSPRTREMLRRLLRDTSGCCSTWNNAWLVLAVHDYMSKVQGDNVEAVVNGRLVAPGRPLRLNLSTDDTTTFSSQGADVYVSGYAGGHLKDRQPGHAENHGIEVSRNYEVLQSDGSWAAADGNFRVGDTVRVTITALRANRDSEARYMVLEDRLPAAFEAVNPKLLSQSLPEGVEMAEARSWWRISNSFDHKEYLKDRVRFFSSYVYEDGLQASYVVRVVRSGKVTAPAAKAELMYEPRTYGLSIPQQFDVAPREGKSAETAKP